MKPRIFIGSASESKNVAEAILENLDSFARVDIWDQIFDPGQYTLEALEEELDKANFGIFVFTNDDVAKIRDEEFSVTRDNVLYELGLFSGRLGRKRCFVVLPKPAAGSDYHLPTDLIGITLLTYSIPSADSETYTQTTRFACNKIRNAIAACACGIDSGTKQAISSMLQGTVKLIADRYNLKDDKLRAYCHLADVPGQYLRPVASNVTTEKFTDEQSRIPIKEPWYIISRTFNTKKYVCDKVDWTIDKTKVQKSDEIWGDIKSIIAAPLKGGDEVIGTVDFNSNKPLEQTGWAGDKNLEDAVLWLADSIATMVTRTR